MKTINHRWNSVKNGLEEDWLHLLSFIQEHTKSLITKEKISALGILPTQEEATEKLEKILELKKILQKEDWFFDFEFLDNFDFWHTTVKKGGVLNPRQLSKVKDFLSLAYNVQQFVKQQSIKNPLSTRKFVIIEFLEKINSIIDSSGSICSTATDSLQGLMKSKQEHVDRIQRKLDKIIKSHELEPILQERFVTIREGRWVIPVKSGMRHNLEGLIHDMSQTHQTVFIEPEAVFSINNEIKEIDIEIEKEIEKIMREISQELSSFSLWEKLFDKLAEFDSYLCIAKFSVFCNLEGFEFSKEGIILKNFFHPLLVAKKQKIIYNSVHLLSNEKKVLILSGPNAGGKTVFLKSIGLSLKMALCGIPIPASGESKVPFLEQIFPIVGDHQEVMDSVSTFESHVLQLKESLIFDNQAALILVDEICSSTEPQEAVALASSILEQYIKNDIFVVVTTHFQFPMEIQEKVLLGSMAYDFENKKPTYAFIEGVSGNSLAISMAQGCGMPQGVIDRAESFLSSDYKKIREENFETERRRKQWAVAKEKADVEKQGYEEKKDEYQKLLKDIEVEKEEKISSMVREKESEIDEKIKKAELEKVFLKHQELQKIKQDFPKMITEKNKKEELESGDLVYIVSMNKTGVYQSRVNGTDQALVLLDSMQIKIPIRDLEKREKSNFVSYKNFKKEPKEFSQPLQYGDGFKKVSTLPKASSLEIDVRGKKFLECEETIDKSLDQCLKRGHDKLVIIHGVGTQRLRKKIQEFLEQHHLRKTFTVEKSSSGSTEVIF